MCGVPFHAIDAYMTRLIKQGFRVAICEQAETPEQAKARKAKGPLRRDVVRIVTPGTLIEDTFLPPRENNYLITLFHHTDTCHWRRLISAPRDIMVETMPPSQCDEALPDGNLLKLSLVTAKLIWNRIWFIQIPASVPGQHDFFIARMVEKNWKRYIKWLLWMAWLIWDGGISRSRRVDSLSG